MRNKLGRELCEFGRKDGYISKIRQKLRRLPIRQLIAYITLACNWSATVEVRLCRLASTYNVWVIIMGTCIFSFSFMAALQVIIISHKTCSQIQTNFNQS